MVSTFTHSELMDHRRDQHNSGNKMCCYFKEGICFYMDEKKGRCWYLHKSIKSPQNTESCEDFTCSFSDNDFKTKSEVMQHRIKEHEEEVPICNSIKDGRR